MLIFSIDLFNLFCRGCHGCTGECPERPRFSLHQGAEKVGITYYKLKLAKTFPTSTPYSVVYIQPDRMFRFSRRYNWLFPLAAPLLHRQLLSDIRVMHDFTDKVISERRETVRRAKADGTYRPLSGCTDSAGSHM